MPAGTSDSGWVQRMARSGPAGLLLLTLRAYRAGRRQEASADTAEGDTAGMRWGAGSSPPRGSANWTRYGSDHLLSATIRVRSYEGVVKGTATREVLRRAAVSQYGYEPRGADCKLQRFLLTDRTVQVRDSKNHLRRKRAVQPSCACGNITAVQIEVRMQGSGQALTL